MRRRSRSRRPQRRSPRGPTRRRARPVHRQARRHLRAEGSGSDPTTPTARRIGIAAPAIHGAAAGRPRLARVRTASRHGARNRRSATDRAPGRPVRVGPPRLSAMPAATAVLVVDRPDGHPDGHPRRGRPDLHRGPRPASATDAATTRGDRPTIGQGHTTTDGPVRPAPPARTPLPAHRAPNARTARRLPAPSPQAAVDGLRPARRGATGLRDRHVRMVDHAPTAPPGSAPPRLPIPTWWGRTRSSSRVVDR
jgi:hypothetical protein